MRKGDISAAYENDTSARGALAADTLEAALSEAPYTPKKLCAVVKT
jgi:hypothetical protein